MDIKVLPGYDVIVIGGGTAGVPAAIAAGRNKSKTLLVERSSALGGIVASGMPAGGFLDRQLNKVVGGIPLELVKELGNMHQSIGPLRCPMHNSIVPLNGWWYRIVASQKCKDAGVDVLYNAVITGVTVDSAKITGVTLISGTVQYNIPCKVLIDASGDAVAAYLAGAKYEMGQPETMNDLGVNAAENGQTGHGKVQPVSITFNLSGVNVDAFNKYNREHPETYKSPSGYGMNYDKPYIEQQEAVYFTGYGEFIEKARAAGEFDIPRDRVIFATQPTKGEYMINATRVTDVDPTDPMDMSRATTECYRQIAMLTNFFRKYCPGFENCQIASIAHYVGPRESRRITGKKKITRELIDGLEIPEDAIALCGYNLDIHLVGKGLYFQPVEHAVGVPYGCLVSENIDGLLVAGRCISMDAYSLGLFRAMGVCEAMGEAAGTAAAMAVKEGISVTNIDVQKLRKILVGNGAIVSLK